MSVDEHISPDFPFVSNYVSVLGSKIHYIDEGQGEPILYLHGNPTWSYLWRNIIPHLSSFGRCIAPDLIGMGRSDKPDLEYRFVDHMHYIEGFIETLNLKNLTLVLHGWGSVIGFHYARRNEDNIRGLAFMESLLFPFPSWEAFPEESRQAFQRIRSADVGWDMIVNQNLFVEQFLPGGVVRPLTAVEMDYYREPFIEPASRKPVWRFPNESPIGGQPADVAEAVVAYNEWLQQTPLPKILFYTTPGDLTPASQVEWCVQHLDHLKTVNVGEGYHYVQEDHPHRIGVELARWYQGLKV